MNGDGGITAWSAREKVQRMGSNPGPYFAAARADAERVVRDQMRAEGRRLTPGKPRRSCGRADADGEPKRAVTPS